MNDKTIAGTPDELNSGKVVTVGCKLPHGLLMELGKRGSDNYKAVMVRGSQSSRIVNGFGMTEVTEDFMTDWLKKNKSLSFVKKGLIFIMPNATDAAAVAKERSELKTGFERLDPSKAPKGVEIDDKHLKAGAKELAALRRAAA